MIMDMEDLWNLFHNVGFACMAQFLCLHTSVVLGAFF